MGRSLQEKHMLTMMFSADVDIRVRVRGGGHTSQIYAIRQAIAKSIVSPHHSLVAGGQCRRQWVCHAKSLD